MILYIVENIFSPYDKTTIDQKQDILEPLIDLSIGDRSVSQEAPNEW